MKSLQFLMGFLLIGISGPAVHAQSVDPRTAIKIDKLVTAFTSRKNETVLQCKNPPVNTVDLCEDLAAMACYPGVISDGTGFSWKGNEKESELRDRAEIEGYAREYFNEKLKKKSLVRNLIFQKCPMESQREVMECAVKYGTSVALNEIPEDKQLNREATFTRRVLHHLKNKKNDLIMGEFHQFLKEKILKQKLAREVEDDFSVVKRSLISWIQRSDTADFLKKKMIKKIRKIHFSGTYCEDVTFLDDKVDPLLEENAFYDTEKNQFWYCNGLERSNSSLFSRYFTIAHELAHSIDPDSFRKDPFPYYGLKPCLLSKEAAGATELQLNETFADFVGTEVLADIISRKKLTPEQYQNGVANILRDSDACGELGPKDPHQSDADRINRIFMANPKIKKLTGCEKLNKVKYCGPAAGIHR